LKYTKTVVLAGGLGSRLSEETDVKPKPMVEIGGMPILWHIMKIYGHDEPSNSIHSCRGMLISDGASTIDPSSLKKP
jgi:molybdopterin-guanine dinucleotide biosynthesis protein A